jgi:hypothetical protein
VYHNVHSETSCLTTVSILWYMCVQFLYLFSAYNQFTGPAEVSETHPDLHFQAFVPSLDMHLGTPVRDEAEGISCAVNSDHVRSLVLSASHNCS